MKSLFCLFRQQFLREFTLHSRQLNHLLSLFLFFILFVIIFPLSTSPAPETLRQLAPGLVWMALLLSYLMSADRLFAEDYAQGIIEQWLSSGESLPLLVFSKIGFHCILNLLPLLLLCPLIGLLFSLKPYEITILLASLCSGAPALLFLSALAAIFGIGARQSGVLMALILFPLTVPLIIFGSGSVLAAMQGLGVSAYLALLLAISLTAASLLPFAIAAVIRISLAD